MLGFFFVHSFPIPFAHQLDYKPKEKGGTSSTLFITEFPVPSVVLTHIPRKCLLDKHFPPICSGFQPALSLLAQVLSSLSVIPEGEGAQRRQKGPWPVSSLPVCPGWANSFPKVTSCPQGLALSRMGFPPHPHPVLPAPFRLGRAPVFQPRPKAQALPWNSKHSAEAMQKCLGPGIVPLFKYPYCLSSSRFSSGKIFEVESWNTQRIGETQIIPPHSVE